MVGSWNPIEEKVREPSQQPDASTTCAGACVYLSCKLSTGEWSSQLLTAKSRLVNYTVPRNELEAIVLGTELTFAAIASLRLPLQSVVIASDSLVAISWAMNDRARNKTFVSSLCRDTYVG